jgi:hypothetical protein
MTAFTKLYPWITGITGAILLGVQLWRLATETGKEDVVKRLLKYIGVDIAYAFICWAIWGIVKDGNILGSKLGSFFMSVLDILTFVD